MYKQYDVVNLVNKIQGIINNGTTITAYDVVPKDTVAPFAVIELVKISPADTKNWYVKQYDFYIHVIAAGKQSSVPIYRYIKEIEEAFTDDIALPEPYQLVAQIDNGLQTLYTEETGEKHAVLPFTFKIAYDLKVK